MAMMKAIVILEGGKSAGVRDVPMPKLRDEWVLVEVKAIGLNPTDWKHIDYGAADTGCRVGCDYAGIVEEVGRKVTRFKKGDRIAGLVHGW
jgi:NADPH:quinone reductase-like Zn-dependent oxidoreductase